MRWMTSILHDMRNLFFCNWVEAKEHIQNSEGILITLGSVEEHGCHLPLGTDTILAEAIAKELCQREDMYYYPCTTYGQVWSARDFESTISITPDCLGEYCIQAVRSVMRAHPRRIFLFSFHNGNHKVIEEVQRRLVDEGERETVFHIKLAGMEKKAADILTTPMWNGKVWHAGELETSLMLHVAGDLVYMERATAEFPQVPDCYGQRPIPWRSFLKSGAFGDAAAATPEKGEKLFELVCSDLQEQIRQAKGEKAFE